ncbi:MAG TPA: hypothetical protein VJR58_07285 [Vineibacter sp.]|nr:hypothetical protein [Vineibacter sp.]
MQRFRQGLTALLMVVMAWTAAFGPAAALASLPLASATATADAVAPCDTPCDDCHQQQDCNTQAGCLVSCLRLVSQPLAQPVAPVMLPIGPVSNVDRPTHAATFASRIIRPLLPPPRA